MIYEFIKHAIIAGIFASIICGVLGVYIVLKRMAFISSGIAHGAFGGIGLGILLHINPIITALVFSVFSALGIEYSKEKSKLHEDTAIGILMSVGMALGIILISISKTYSVDLFGFLFGNILSVTLLDVYILMCLTAITLLFFYFFFKEFVVISFDEEYGKALGIPVEKLKIVFLMLVAFTVVLLIKIVGIVLVVALLTLPAAISRRFTKNMKNMIYLSVIISLISVVLGLSLSWYLDIPSGATIVLTNGIIFLLSCFKE